MYMYFYHDDPVGIDFKEVLLFLKRFDNLTG